MQLSKPAEFVPVPDWYFNIEYMEEQKRGYDFKEDLYVPGYFEMPIKKGESIVFSASTSEASPGGFKRKFTVEHEQRISKDSLKACLLNAAQQFIVRKSDRTEIKAGFPWHGTWGRDTFMALPGLCLSTGDLSTALEVIDSMVARMKQGLFPTMASKGKPAFKSADAPMWFIRALQQYAKYDPKFDMWAKYGRAIKEVMEIYREGRSGIIRMLDNGLIYTDDGQNPLTWMDAVVNGRMVTPRTGLAVEVNALWYNAVCQALLWSEKKDKTFYKSWSHLPELIRSSFVDQFWDQDRGYLADYVNGDFKDYSVRPSQVIAVSVDHSPLSSEMKKSILDVVQSELLTPRGLRSLSPKNEAYEGVCEGNHEMRDRAYHQGTAWPWILEHYARGVLDVHKKSGQSQVKKIYDQFEEEMTVRGIGSISEIYDGNPPHYGRGTISQATSVAALLRIGEMIEGF